LCRVAPHCTRDLTAVVKVVDKIDASSFDSRGVFIACSVEHGVYIWVGADCTRANEWIDVAKHHVSLSQKYFFFLFYFIIFFYFYCFHFLIVIFCS
jgi:hypothetical protein